MSNLDTDFMAVLVFTVLMLFFGVGIFAIMSANTKEKRESIEYTIQHIPTEYAVDCYVIEAGAGNPIETYCSYKD